MSIDSRPSRDECPRCGSSMRHVGKSEPLSDGHHGTVFECRQCDREVIRG